MNNHTDSTINSSELQSRYPTGFKGIIKIIFFLCLSVILPVSFQPCHTVQGLLKTKKLDKNQVTARPSSSPQCTFFSNAFCFRLFFNYFPTKSTNLNQWFAGGNSEGKFFFAVFARAVEMSKQENESGILTMT